jgi:hypothetical protein
LARGGGEAAAVNHKNTHSAAGLSAPPGPNTDFSEANGTLIIFKDQTHIEIRLVVDRSIVEVFVMSGRAVFTKTFGPHFAPDTHVVVEAAAEHAAVQSAEVWSMGCGWTNAPYQPHPTMSSITEY